MDLHIHTNFSDGSLTPQEVVDISIRRGLKVISITDHDNVEGVYPAICKSNIYNNIEVIPGIEISARCTEANEAEVHILGYYINFEDSMFLDKLKFYRQERKKRALQIIDKFRKIGINLDTSLFDTDIPSIGRLHIAKCLIENGLVRNVREAFEKYLAYNRPCYVMKTMFSIDEAIKAILDVGGIPILAHPMVNFNNIKTIDMLIKKGISGIEVWHTKHTRNDIDILYSYAKSANLLITGGSDCHGYVDNMEPIIGKMKVPYEIFLSLNSYHKKTLL